MTGAQQNGDPIRPVSDGVIVGIVCAYAAAFVAFGLLVDGPGAVLHGLAEIVTTRDALLTDYFGIGGIGAGCVNAGLLTLCAALRLPPCGREDHRRRGRLPVPRPRVRIVRQEPVQRLADRARRLPLRTVQGRGVRRPHQHGLLRRGAGAGLLGDSLQLHAGDAGRACRSRSPPASLIGFILAPVAAQLFKAHMGFSLYNMGFTAGIVGTVVVALYKSYGFVPDPVMIWTTGHNRLAGGFLAVLFASMVADRWLPGSPLGAAVAADHGADRTVADRFHRAGGLRPDPRQHGPDRRDRHGLRAADRRRSQRPRHRCDPDHRRVLGVRQASAQHRPDHGRRLRWARSPSRGTWPIRRSRWRRSSARRWRRSPGASAGTGASWRGSSIRRRR